VRPAKAYTPLIINTDAVLPLSVACERLKARLHKKAMLLFQLRLIPRAVPYLEWQRDTEICGNVQQNKHERGVAPSGEGEQPRWRPDAAQHLTEELHRHHAVSLDGLALREQRIGQKLVAAFLRGSGRENLIVDCLKSAGFAGDLLRHQGFRHSRPLTRMFRGENRFPGKNGGLCAILGPEFG